MVKFQIGHLILSGDKRRSVSTCLLPYRRLICENLRNLRIYFSSNGTTALKLPI